MVPLEACLSTFEPSSLTTSAISSQSTAANPASRAQVRAASVARLICAGAATSTVTGGVVLIFRLPFSSVPPFLQSDSCAFPHRRLDFHFIHETLYAGQTQAQTLAGRVALLHRQVNVGYTRPLVHKLNLQTRSAPGGPRGSLIQ